MENVKEMKTLSVLTAEKEAEKVEVEAVFTAPEATKKEFATVTVADIVDGGLWDRPLFQRGYVWDEEREIKLKDSICRAVPVPPLTVGILEIDGEEKGRLLIDGLQRSTALAHIVDGYGPDMTRYESDELDYILGVDFDVEYVTTDSLEVMAVWFSRLNNGVALSGVQKGKAGLPTEILALTNAYTEWAGATMPSKCGNVNSDTMGMLVAATMAGNGKQISSTGAPAIRLLKKVDKTGIPMLPEWLTSLVTTISVVEDEDYNSRYWFSPSRFLPLCAAIRDTGADMQDVEMMLANFSAMQGKKYRVDPSTRAKKGEAKKVSSTVSAVFSDTSSGVGANYKRYQVLCKLLKNEDAVGEKPAIVTKMDEEAKAVEDALKEAFNL